MSQDQYQQVRKVPKVNEELVNEVLGEVEKCVKIFDRIRKLRLSLSLTTPSNPNQSLLMLGIKLLKKSKQQSTQALSTPLITELQKCIDLINELQAIMDSMSGSGLESVFDIFMPKETEEEVELDIDRLESTIDKFKQKRKLS